MLTLLGGPGNDHTQVGLAGAGNSLINVFDDVNHGSAGINTLEIFGTPHDDFFLLRANTIDHVAMVASYQVDADKKPGHGRILSSGRNYDASLTGGLTIFGREGDDTFVLDDNLAPTTIFGDAGADTFQIGQVYNSPRDGTNPNNGLNTDDYFETTQTTQGFLSNGVSFTTFLYGGVGDDSFTVYRNKSELFLYGQEDDDNFRVRAFVQVDPNDPNAPFTNINGGQGADFISYTVNAPVRIEGGDGFDTPTVIGTEFGDDFVVTDQGVFGAGLYITYAGIEKLVIDAQAGNDRFYIASTSPDVALDLIGGQGSDTFNVGGGNDGQPITVVSKSLDGHSGLISNSVSSADASFNNIFVQGISAKVTDKDSAGIVVGQPQGPLRVFEEPIATNDSRYSLIVANAATIVLSRSARGAGGGDRRPCRSPRATSGASAGGPARRQAATGETLVFGPHQLVSSPRRSRSRSLPDSRSPPAAAP